MNPLKLKIINYQAEAGEKINFEINPQDKALGTREINFSNTLYIEKEDFQENPEEGFFRLSLGEEVRLKNAYIIKAVDLVKDVKGNIIEVLCEYDKKSKSGSNTEESQRKVKGTLHWVSKKASIDVKVNEYDRLFEHPSPASSQNEEELLKMINPN